MRLIRPLPRDAVMGEGQIRGPRDTPVRDDDTDQIGVQQQGRSPPGPGLLSRRIVLLVDASVEHLSSELQRGAQLTPFLHGS
jgi:hypothetical protein